MDRYQLKQYKDYWWSLFFLFALILIILTALCVLFEGTISSTLGDHHKVVSTIDQLFQALPDDSKALKEVCVSPQTVRQVQKEWNAITARGGRLVKHSVREIGFTSELRLTPTTTTVEPIVIAQVVAEFEKCKLIIEVEVIPVGKKYKVKEMKVFAEQSIHSRWV